MSNVDLFLKTKSVLYSCKNMEQREIARKYANLARRKLDPDWHYDLDWEITMSWRLIK